MKKILPLALIGLVAAGSVYYYFHLIANNKIVIGYNKGYEPTQPLPFSHKLHAGDYKIDCQYCHSNVDKSRHATVPSLNICMNCHQVVKPSSPHIQKLAKAYRENKPIQWQKVHLLPDFVRFDHSAHILKGKQCVECHGEIEKMPVVKQTKSLSMGFCVDCHRKPENNAPINCSTCHY